MNPTLPRRRLPAIPRVLLAALGILLAGAPAAAQAEMPSALSDPLLVDYRLTRETLDRFVAATQAMQELGDQAPDMDDEVGEDPSIGDIVAAMDRAAPVREAIAAAGLSTREYVVFMFAMLQAMFGSIPVQMGGPNALDEMPDGVRKDNIRFFIENQEAFALLNRNGEG